MNKYVWLRFTRYFSHHRLDDGRNICPNVAHLTILVHDLINLLSYSVNAGFPQCSILDLILFLQYINDLPDDALCNIDIYIDDTTLYSNSDQDLICGVGPTRISF